MGSRWDDDVEPDGGYGQAEPWRVAPAPVLAPPTRRRRHRLRAVLTVLTLAVGLLLGASSLQEAGRLPVADGTVGGEPLDVEGLVQPAPAEPEQPLPAPERLAPLPPLTGGEGGFVFQDEQDGLPGRPVAYDPCRPVRYVVRPAGEPPGGDALLEQAVARISAATGLVFERGPDTDEPLSEKRAIVQPARYGDDLAPVLVGWSDERESPTLAGDVAGYAGSTWWGWDRPDSRRYVTGLIVIDGEDAGRQLQRPEGADLVRSTILHELGHLVGLGHVDDPAQLMFREGGPERLGPAEGDLRGLRLLGDGACFTDWDDVVTRARERLPAG